MARQVTDAVRPAGGEAAKPDLRRKILVALGAVLVAQALFALCIVSAGQLLAPRNMPFGMVGSSRVVAQAQSSAGLDLIAYPSQSAVMTAIDQGQLYGAYVTGSSSDTLVVVGAKSFFARIDLQAAFLSAAHKLNRPVTVQNAKPLPSSDSTGAVVGLSLLPLLVGGYLAATLVFKAAGGTAAARWRAAILVGYALVGALLTDLIAGPLIGAYPGSHFWPLLPCFWLVTTAVVLAAAALQALVGRLATAAVAVLFIFVGGPGMGGSGTFMLPNYWRNIGVVLPPQNGVSLIRNVLYFGGNNITTPLIVLFVYALAGLAVLAGLSWLRPARPAAAAHSRGDRAEASPAGNPAASPPPGNPAAAGPGRRRRGLLPIVVALGICAIMECLFAFNYMSSGHAPAATNMPFGAVGSSPVLTGAEKTISLKVTQYPNEQAAKTAIDQAQIWGALISSGTSDTLIVVPSISDLSPLDLAVQFENAAKTAGQKLTVQQYTPTPLAPKDPLNLVVSLMLVPVLIGGYVSASLLMAATGKAAGRWRAATLGGFAVVAGLVVDLIVCLGLQGIPSSKFWIVWPIITLIIAVVAFVAAILQKLIGSAGTLLTIILIVLFGNNSSGGANGVPYLPTFWRDIGPFLPPRNAYILLHQTIYFSGHGTTEALTILLAYLAVTLVILGLLDWSGTERPVNPDIAEAAAVAVPAGAAP
jgi:hypothetical protein